MCPNNLQIILRLQKCGSFVSKSLDPFPIIYCHSIGTLERKIVNIRNFCQLFNCTFVKNAQTALNSDRDLSPDTIRRYCTAKSTVHQFGLQKCQFNFNKLCTENQLHYASRTFTKWRFFLLFFSFFWRPIHLREVCFGALFVTGI